MSFSDSVSSAIERARVAYWLRPADRVGSGAVLVGRPYVRNEGFISIGNSFRLCSNPAISHLFTTPTGHIEIGDRVSISFGGSVSSVLEVKIEDDVRIGPYSVVMDSDFHAVGDRSARAESARVNIGKRVVIGQRVTVLRGSVIGDDARVLSGSVVSGNVPAGAVVGGVPAYAATLDASKSNDAARDVRVVVMRIFNLDAVPALSDGPETIRSWDSLGALKLLLALEQEFGVTLGEAELNSARNVGDLVEVLDNVQRKSANRFG